MYKKASREERKKEKLRKKLEKLEKTDKAGPVDKELERKRRDIKHLRRSSHAQWLLPSASVYSAVKSREMAQDTYGADWKKKIKGKPGSFIARHPVGSHFLPLVPQVSSYRAAKEHKRVLDKQVSKAVKKKPKEKRASPVSSIAWPQYMKTKQSVLDETIRLVEAGGMKVPGVLHKVRNLAVKTGDAVEKLVTSPVPGTKRIPHLLPKVIRDNKHIGNKAATEFLRKNPEALPLSVLPFPIAESYVVGKKGVQLALDKLTEFILKRRAGLVKTAADESERPSLVRRALPYTPAIAAGSIPIVGSIGKSKRHDPFGGKNHFNNMADFTKRVRPGDILLVGDQGKMAQNKFWISLGTGTPSSYHVSVVDRVLPNGGLRILNFSTAGYEYGLIDKNAMEWDAPSGTKRSITALRAKNPEVGTKSLENYRRRVDLFQKLQKDLVTKGVSPEAAKKAVAKAFTPATRGTHMALRELFVPYFINNSKRATAEVAEAQKMIGVMEKNTPKFAQLIKDKIVAGKNPGEAIPQCLKGVCSSAVATSGFPVAGKSRAHLASPADALRSKGVKRVASMMPKDVGVGIKAANPLLKVSPFGVRAAFGLGIGLTGAAVTKAVIDKKYIKRWRGRNGKWRYKYPTKDLRGSPVQTIKDTLTLPHTSELPKVPMPMNKLKKAFKDDSTTPAAMLGGGIGTGVALREIAQDVGVHREIKSTVESNVKKQRATAEKRWLKATKNHPILTRLAEKLVGKPDFQKTEETIIKKLTPEMKKGQVLTRSLLKGGLVGVPTAIGAKIAFDRLHRNKSLPE